MDSDDDDFLYGTSNNPSEAPQISVPKPQNPSESNGVVAQLEDEVFDLGELTPPPEQDTNQEYEPEDSAPPEAEDGEEEEESDDDIEIIMEQPSRSLDLRQNRSAPTHSTSVVAAPPKPAAPPPTLTTEYTPIERGGPAKPPPPTPAPSVPQQPAPKATPEAETRTQQSEGPDPNTLPPATAPPSHPQIDPTAVGLLDGRSILEVDLNGLADKPWRRPGSDISDWFNYGFDEISWEAYCYRRKEVGDVSGVLKTNVVSYAGMPEEQLVALPPEIRSMVMASATTFMANGGNPAMLPQNVGMPMMGEMGMNMPQMGMMNEMNGMQMGMQEVVAPGIQGQISQDSGEGFNGQMMNMMGGEYGMQDPNMMQQQQQQQMYQAMEGGNTPVQVPPVRPTPVPFRGRGQPMMRGRGGFAGRGGRGGQPVPVRPASPLPPNVPTGPRNQNKYKDKDRDGNSGVDGLDYGGGRDANSGTPPEERSRKRRGSPVTEDGRSKRR